MEIVTSLENPWIIKFLQFWGGKTLTAFAADGSIPSRSTNTPGGGPSTKAGAEYLPNVFADVSKKRVPDGALG